MNHMALGQKTIDVITGGSLVKLWKEALSLKARSMLLTDLETCWLFQMLIIHVRNINEAPKNASG